MLVSFKNDAWEKCQQRDSFKKILKTLRYHNSLARIDKPTTQLIFISRFQDITFRSYFEDSSRHFKTYNTGFGIFEFFDFDDQHSHLKNGVLPPSWFLTFLFKLNSVAVLAKLMSLFFGAALESHFKLRSRLHSYETQVLVKMLASSFKTIGIVEFSRLNVLIVDPSDLNQQYGGAFICDLFQSPNVRSLFNAEGLITPENSQFVLSYYNKNKNTFKFFSSAKDDPENSFNYLLKKADFVESRISSLKLLQAPSPVKVNVLVFGRRSLSRGSDLDNKNIFLQSYDFENDPDLKQLLRLLMLYVANIMSNGREGNLIVIEHNPKIVKELLVREERLRDVLTGHLIAVACIDPSTKDIYALEGTQFVQQFFF